MSAQTAGAEEFRTRVRAFLAEQLPDGWRGCGALSPEEYDAWVPRWRQALSDAHLLAPAWPREYGGGGLGVAEQAVLSEEFTRAGVLSNPLPTDGLGFVLLGPTLLAWGTPEQKAYFLPRTISGEIRWAQGYSEPDAGSDLFALRTRARREGDEWVIDGEKVWQTAGPHANWIFLLARTDPEAPKSRGLSFLLVPIDQPGVTVRPITNMAGQAEFAGFAFEGARTRASHIVGGEGNGAQVALTLLGFERGTGALAAAMSYRIELERLVELIVQRGRAHDDVVRQRVADCYTKVEILKRLGLRTLAAGVDGRAPGPESSVLKLYTGEYHKEVTELALDVLGLDAITPSGPPGLTTIGPDPRGVDPLSARAWTSVAMLARAGTIYGGSSQIMRDTIAERILGLPREDRRAGGGAR